MGAPFMWILKKKYDYLVKKIRTWKTDRVTKTSLFDRNWVISLKPRRRSRPLCLVWWALDCTVCCQFLWIVYFWLPLQYSLMFIRGRRGLLSYGSWIYNYLYNQCLKLWVRTLLMLRCTRYITWYKVCQWLATGRRFPPSIKLTTTI